MQRQKCERYVLPFVDINVFDMAMGFICGLSYNACSLCRYSVGSLNTGFPVFCRLRKYYFWNVTASR